MNRFSVVYAFLVHLPSPKYTPETVFSINICKTKINTIHVFQIVSRCRYYIEPRVPVTNFPHKYSSLPATFYLRKHFTIQVEISEVVFIELAFSHIRTSHQRYTFTNKIPRIMHKQFFIKKNSPRKILYYVLHTSFRVSEERIQFWTMLESFKLSLTIFYKHCSFERWILFSGYSKWILSKII